MQEVIARGAKVLLITNKSKDEVVSENIWETIEVENTNDDLLPFLLTIPLQKLAYYSALKKGYDIDKLINVITFFKSRVISKFLKWNSQKEWKQVIICILNLNSFPNIF